MNSDDERYEFYVARYPFSRGVRAAYRGKLKKEGSGNWLDCVLKEFIYPPDLTLVEYMNQSEKSAVAKYLRDEYQKTHRLHKSMRVLPSRILKLTERDGSETLYNIEEFLSGTFDK